MKQSAKLRRLLARLLVFAMVLNLLPTVVSARPTFLQDATRSTEVATTLLQAHIEVEEVVPSSPTEPTEPTPQPTESEEPTPVEEPEDPTPVEDMGRNLHLIHFVRFLVLVLFFVDYTHEKNISLREVLDRQPLFFRWIVYIAAIVIILVFGMYGPQYDAASFIYAQF